MIGRVFVSIDPVVRPDGVHEGWELSVAWFRHGNPQPVSVCGSDHPSTSTRYPSVESAIQGARKLMDDIQTLEHGGAR